MNLYQKINEVKKVVKVLSKDAETSGYGKYSYVSGSQILGLIKDKMEELQLLFVPVETLHRGWTTYDYKTSNNVSKTDFIVDGEIIYEWINAEKPDERQRVKFEYYGQQNDISKAFGSGLTYSERYILLKSLGAPTDDEDPDLHTEDKPSAKKQKPVNKSINDPFEDVPFPTEAPKKEGREKIISTILGNKKEYVERLRAKMEQMYGIANFEKLNETQYKTISGMADEFAKAKGL